MATHRTTDAAVRHKVGRHRPANDAAYTPPITRPPTLWLEQGSTRVLRQDEDSKRDELWQGDGYLDKAAAGDADADVPIYFRLAERHTLAAELVCAVMARALGLPTPQPYVLHIAPGVLPGSRFADVAQTHLCVATHDLGGQDFAQLLRQDTDFAKKLLREWALLVPTATFDEWVANLDRNFGNILFVAQSLWLIDHAEAFGGCNRPLFPLRGLTKTAFTNKLALLLGEGNPARRKARLVEAKQWLTLTAGSLNVEQLANHAHPWQNPDEERELVDFLQNRLAITHQLLCHRLGHPELPLPL